MSRLYPSFNGCRCLNVCFQVKEEPISPPNPPGLFPYKVVSPSQSLNLTKLFTFNDMPPPGFSADIDNNVWFYGILHNLIIQYESLCLIEDVGKDGYLLFLCGNCRSKIFIFRPNQKFPFARDENLLKNKQKSKSFHYDPSIIMFPSVNDPIIINSCLPNFNEYPPSNLDKINNDDNSFINNHNSLSSQSKFYFSSNFNLAFHTNCLNNLPNLIHKNLSNDNKWGTGGDKQSLQFIHSLSLNYPIPIPNPYPNSSPNTYKNPNSNPSESPSENENEIKLKVKVNTAAAAALSILKDSLQLNRTNTLLKIEKYCEASWDEFNRFAHQALCEYELICKNIMECNKMEKAETKNFLPSSKLDNHTNIHASRQTQLTQLFPSNSNPSTVPVPVPGPGPGPGSEPDSDLNHQADQPHSGSYRTILSEVQILNNSLSPQSHDFLNLHKQSPNNSSPGFSNTSIPVASKIISMGGSDGKFVFNESPIENSVAINPTQFKKGIHFKSMSDSLENDQDPDNDILVNGPYSPALNPEHDHDPEKNLSDAENVFSDSEKENDELFLGLSNDEAEVEYEVDEDDGEVAVTNIDPNDSLAMAEIDELAKTRSRSNNNSNVGASDPSSTNTNTSANINLPAPNSKGVTFRPVNMQSARVNFNVSGSNSNDPTFNRLGSSLPIAIPPQLRQIKPNHDHTVDESKDNNGDSVSSKPQDEDNDNDSDRLDRAHVNNISVPFSQVRVSGRFIRNYQSTSTNTKSSIAQSQSRNDLNLPIGTGTLNQNSKIQDDNTNTSDNIGKNERITKHSSVRKDDRTAIVPPHTLVEAPFFSFAKAKYLSYQVHSPIMKKVFSKDQQSTQAALKLFNGNNSISLNSIHKDPSTPSPSHNQSDLHQSNDLLEDEVDPLIINNATSNLNLFEKENPLLTSNNNISTYNSKKSLLSNEIHSYLHNKQPKK